MKKTACAAFLAAALPVLALPTGDGVTDDTAEMQKLLDAKGLVSLETPGACYRISRSLSGHLCVPDVPRQRLHGGRSMT